MTQARFQQRMTIPFQDVDAAGVVFFAHLFRYAHEVYEQFMAASDYSLAHILQEGLYQLPLVHAEADYRLPLRHHQQIVIEMWVEKVGNSSFKLRFIYLDDDASLCASVETVHVVLDSKTQSPVAIPEVLRTVLGDGSKD